MEFLDEGVQRLLASVSALVDEGTWFVRSPGIVHRELEPEKKCSVRGCFLFKR